MKGESENMEKHLQECIKPHMLIHALTGIGIGLLLPILVPRIGDKAFIIAIGCILIAMVGEFVLAKTKKG